MSTVTTINDTKVELTLTCITGQDAGWYSGTTKYYVSYKLTSASSWTNTSSQTCGSAIQISGLAAVSSYTFAAYAENDFDLDHRQLLHHTELQLPMELPLLLHDQH